MLTVADPKFQTRKRYDPRESVGIATGMRIAAPHHAGVAALIHRPSRMKFVKEILGRRKISSGRTCCWSRRSSP
jgi:hypothetical protein